MQVHSIKVLTISNQLLLTLWLAALLDFLLIAHISIVLAMSVVEFLQHVFPQKSSKLSFCSLATIKQSCYQFKSRSFLLVSTKNSLLILINLCLTRHPSAQDVECWLLVVVLLLFWQLLILLKYHHYCIAFSDKPLLHRHLLIYH